MHVNALHALILQSYLLELTRANLILRDTFMLCITETSAHFRDAEVMWIKLLMQLQLFNSTINKNSEPNIVERSENGFYGSYSWWILRSF